MAACVPKISRSVSLVTLFIWTERREGGKGLSCLMEEAAAAAAASIYSVNQDECVCTTYEVLNGPPLRGEEEISRETSKETLSG